jgi:glycosyltransferase involved in cell wall biosynthesis
MDMDFDVILTSISKNLVHERMHSRVLFVKEDDPIDLDRVYEFYIDSKINKTSAPLISVFTPLYNTGELLRETYLHLTAQTLLNWEWVLIDDSNDNKTWEIASEIASEDPRVKLFKQSKRSGNIGYLKNKAASLCDGDILVELDHDDILTEDALKIIFNAFWDNPDCDYLYSDSVELMEDGSSHMYSDGFGMWCGKYDNFEYNAKQYKSANVPINCWTIRHNVGLPNHVRAWRRDFYQRINGHSYLPVGDDHELSVRSFLNTKIIHVNRCLYFQRIFNNGSNTTRTRNAEIQRVSAAVFDYYNYQTHEKILELGKKDHCWDGINKRYDISNPPEVIEDYSTIFSG